MRVSELSEKAYERFIEPNSLAWDEFSAIYDLMEQDPRRLGRMVDLTADGEERWVYESPRITGRPRLRIYFTIREPVVTLWTLALL